MQLTRPGENHLQNSSSTFPGSGRAIFMRKIQNGHDQQRNADYEIQFLICTHKHHLQTGSERVQHVPGFPVKCTIIFYIHRHVRQINN